MEIDGTESENEPTMSKRFDFEPRLGDEPEEFVIQGSIDDPREGKPRTTPGEELKKVQVDQPTQI